MGAGGRRAGAAAAAGVAFGLVTWAMRRPVAARAVAAVSACARVRTRLLGGDFLAWWLPLDMGVRPEGVVALAGTGTLLAVLIALRRQSLGWAGVAVLVAAVGFVCHPTGFDAARAAARGLPGAGPAGAVRRVPRTVARALCLIAPGAVAGVIAFSDGDVARLPARAADLPGRSSRSRAGSTSTSATACCWAPAFMGAYAKRLPVLVTLVALGGWLVLAAALRARGRRLPVVLHLSAVTSGSACCCCGSPRASGPSTSAAWPGWARCS